MKHAGTINTERLAIRQVEVSDAQALHIHIGQDGEMSRYTGWNPYATLESATSKIEHDLTSKGIVYSWVIEHAGQVVGSIGAYDYDPDANSLEIGYSVFRAWWGRGFATEAVSAVVSHLSAQGFSLRAWASDANTPSVRVLQRCGFAPVGRVDHETTQWEKPAS